AVIEMLARVGAAQEADTGYTEEDYETLAITLEPKGVPIVDLSAAVREKLGQLVQVHLSTLPLGLAPPVNLDALCFAWAGSSDPGGAHYYRLQGGGLLIEWDKTTRNANH